jgi:hypothetical protein
MIVESITEIKKYLKNRGERLKSLGLFELKEFEEKVNVTLPKEYRDFLLLMGRSAGNYMKGSSVFYEQLLHLKEWTDELINENNLPPLPPDAFPFWMHQGYQAAYFRTTEGDNPPVYYFTEGKDLKDFILDTKCLTHFF